MSSRYLPDLAGTFSDFSVKGFLRKPGNYMTASGTNTYTSTPSPALTAYTTGLSLDVVFTNANTGASTYNVSGLGAKAIQSAGVALTSGQIVAGATYTLVYDGTHFQLLGSPGPQGATGATGATGANGHGATTATGAPTLTLGIYIFPVVDSAAFLVHGYAFVSDGTNSIYSVIASVPDSTHVGLLLGGSTTTGSLASFTTGTMTFAGQPGAAGATGPQGPSQLTTTTALPTGSGTSRVFAVTDASGFAAGMFISCSDGINLLSEATITSISSNDITVSTSGSTTVGTINSITIGSQFYSMGAKGATGAAGATGSSTSFLFRTSGMSVPLTTNFTVFNGTTLTATDKSDRLQLAVTGASGTTLRGYKNNTALPSRPYTIDTCFDVQSMMVTAGTSHFAGLFLTDGTKYLSLLFGLGEASTSSAIFRVSVDTWTLSTGGTLTTLIRNASWSSPSAVYLRITDDATTRKFYLSVNGKDYALIFSHASSTFISAPANAGIALYCDDTGSGANFKSAFFDYEVTGSVLGDAA